VAATPLKQAKNTFAARTVSNGSIKKTTAMQGEQCACSSAASPSSAALPSSAPCCPCAAADRPIAFVLCP
jgi:hypothetical protein